MHCLVSEFQLRWGTHWLCEPNIHYLQHTPVLAHPHGSSKSITLYQQALRKKRNSLFSGVDKKEQQKMASTVYHSPVSWLQSRRYPWIGSYLWGGGAIFWMEFSYPELVASAGSVFRTWISPLPCLGEPRTGLIVRNGADDHDDTEEDPPPPMPELLVLSLRLEPASNCPSLPQLQTGLFYPRSWVQLARAFFQLGSARGLHKVIYWFVTCFEPKYNHYLKPYFLTLFLKGAEAFVWGCSQTQAELEL